MITSQNTLSPGLHFMQVMHDNDCPKLTGGECQCKPEVHMVDQAAWVDSYVKTRKQRREAEREAEKAIRRAARSKADT